MQIINIYVMDRNFLFEFFNLAINSQSRESIKNNQDLPTPLKCAGNWSIKTILYFLILQQRSFQFLRHRLTSILPSILARYGSPITQHIEINRGNRI